MTTQLHGIEFDPGFAPFIFAFQPSIEYLYSDINRFKNLSQRKIKFKQYYKKILTLFRNNLGFYVGCLMWAEYIKTLPKQDIIHNNYYGQNFDEKENTYEVDFMINFTTLFPKDMKYFLGENFEFSESYLRILNLYRNFLIINKGFTTSKTNEDILLPDGIKNEFANNFKDKIDIVLKEQDLSKLLEYKDLL